MGWMGVSERPSMDCTMAAKAAGRDFGGGEAAAGEPCGEGVDVVLSGAVEFAHLLGGEPLVVAGRGGVLLVGEQLGEVGLKLGRAREDKGEMEIGLRGDRASVGGGIGPAREMAGEAHRGGQLRLHGDPVGLRDLRRQGSGGKGDEYKKNAQWLAHVDVATILVLMLGCNSSLE